jgi:hypothetical protein
MIRVLVMIAVAGFLLSVATIGAAVAIGGPEVLSHAAWTWGANRHWDFDRHWDHDEAWSRWDDDARGGDSGPQKTRDLSWTGGDTLEIDVPAEVRYTQAAGPAKLTISGSQRAVDNIEVDNGHIRFAHGHRRYHGSKLSIVMTAPDVSRFDLHGSSSLAIENYRQDRLRIDLSGNADVTAAGEANVVELDISGSAQADLGKVKAKGAQVDIAGSGDATIAPTDWAKVDISGSGDVTLLSHPPKLDTDISGAGSIHQDEGGTATPSPSPSPSETPSPSPSKSQPKSGKKL